MNYILGVLQTILPVLLVISIGIFCRRKSILSREGIDTLKHVAVNIALPAVLLNAFATTGYSIHNILIPLMMFLVCIGAWLMGSIIQKLFCKENRFIPFLVTGFEAGMLGYTLFTMLYGSEHIASFAIVDLGQVLFVFTVYKILLNKEFTDEASSQSILRSMVTSPIILAIVAGVLIGATGLYDMMKSVGVNSIFDNIVSFVSAPTSVLILLSIGYDLVLDHIPWKKVLQTLVIRLAVMLICVVIVTLLLKNVFHSESSLIRAAWVMFILPPPYVLPIFADDETQYTYLSSTLTIYTLFSILCFSVLAFIV